MPEPVIHREYRDAEKPFSVSHFFHVLYRYLPVITLAMAAVAIGYVLIAALIFLLGPAERITTLGFRLDFQGSTEARYPNGLKFSPAEIVSPPVLRRVYDANNLSRFVPWDVFSRSFVVLESNRAYELLVLEYQARLADPKLSPVDRERIEKEFESKRASLAKNDYALIYTVSDEKDRLPKTIGLKSMTNVLQEWADYAKRERRVLQYRVAVLSPNIFRQSALNEPDYVIAIQVLRSNLYRLLDDVNALKKIPSAELAQTKDGLVLDDVEARLDNLVRFRLEPLVPLIRANNLVRNPEMTIRFVEAQLAYDQRMLQGKQEMVKNLQQALAAYDPSNAKAPEATATAGQIMAPSTPDSQRLMPVISEDFLDRLVTLSRQAADLAYRQRVVDSLLDSSQSVVPWQLAVQYDEDLLKQLRTPSGGGGSITAQEVEQRIRAAEAEARELQLRVHDLYRIISMNLDPRTEIYTMTSVPITRTERSITLPRLAIWGVVVLLVSFPLIVAACLVHNRVREEEAEEEYAER